MRLKKEIVAMLLAGGQGTRLHALTKNMAKPAVPFGGKYRIIDFPLSNCVNSGISTVGVLTQFMPLELNSYIGNGSPWDLDRMDGGLSILPPYTGGETGDWYKGTSNAIYQNLKYIEQYDPEYVLILSGDHIYKMNYNDMLEFHKKRGADLTIAHINVTLEEASRFGILNTLNDLSVSEFVEKPAKPISTKASMGIYIFKWSELKKYLSLVEDLENTSYDFGKDMIPMMLNDGKKIFAYPFEGYWKDVGTIESLWQANMDLLHNVDEFNIFDPLWRIYCRHYESMPQYIGADAKLSNSMISEGSIVNGKVVESVISSGVIIEEGAEIYNSVIMKNAFVGKGAKIYNSIVAEEAKIESGAKVGHEKIVSGKDMITVVGNSDIINSNSEVKKQL
ncbi:glucose-1-phosphate adenylyltransferase [Peptostreptococcus porci]|uniref:Glucose-1-phosphate adenylyltransferase n=2 Tax=Peptostreptococcus porci TaxID=2652282 RepID=A0A6N7WZA4_9FIRM|nr:glucose-1-phosphate adenylyltransferase [Peptostreptococcus porci]MDY2794568.1 glucose-1-phosphate adenylyltransferase [Peptostreptococcus porci]MDY4128399.1 glucose-1-phosphate adenylyltransferase [Peptostreptococcus porci]MDY4561768.1 glucose-1-phosphate adenylyltransferase [Peptostreptococcus porci]MDY5436433.1 glucose-1-phosphate adenylyltransferase [Peptostreptococcus porci]MDY5480453.1 glucose-1-phosphate adenylyltransferase [Peptostreptococcus porci]